MFAIPTRYYRILVQGAVFSLWVTLIVSTRYPMESWIARHIPVSLLLGIDPLVMTVICGGMRVGVTILMLGFVTLAVSLLLGRVFCGWVCPLGTVFDFYGWFLRRLRVNFEGPSPWWFRLKYYVLAMVLVFALLGAVGPLMGFDPIVIITRVTATVIDPLIRQRANIPWGTYEPVKYYGDFVSVSTLLLFMLIMGATTRVSRIWCRTTCPLGAYLAVLSRNSLLKRDTKDCIHCNLCANHCPTGAIHFDNEEIYNESECIKCFSCSQECPVDANFFSFKAPTSFGYAHHPVSLERRTLFSSLAGAFVSIPFLKLSGGVPKNQKKLLRPPMSREERDFLSSCIRCTECVKACPTGILKSAGLQFGLRSLWTPVMVPTEGACKEGCNACSQACPTDAILKYPVEQKYAFKSGTAVLESSRCIGYTENKFCCECVRACPTNAISFFKDWEPIPTDDVKHSKRGADVPAPDGKTATRPVHVSYDKCIGCGACEFECNQIVFGTPAIEVTSTGRAIPSKLT